MTITRTLLFALVFGTVSPAFAENYSAIRWDLVGHQAKITLAADWSGVLSEPLSTLEKCEAEAKVQDSFDTERTKNFSFKNALVGSYIADKELVQIVMQRDLMEKECNDLLATAYSQKGFACVPLRKWICMAPSSEIAVLI